ncbi:MAG: nickel pincer cofactor biosynthesis protein LarB [Acidobacteriota bacterium]|nr:nickel pincer cofactor biosynthesis protein LarB [Acidobacteriota bacterium]MDQ7087801.1 nickel pincer cofactor biosynthesis protein LarB [Acidobacteriota bacterium]
MDRQEIAKLLREVRSGKTGVAQAVERLSTLGTAQLSSARIDHQRPSRRGIPEVILGEGKTTDQILEIVEHLFDKGATVLVTRLLPGPGKMLAERFPRGRYDPLSRTFSWLSPGRGRRKVKGLTIVSAGTADLPVAEEAAVTAAVFSLDVERIYDVGVAGLHRLLEHLEVLRRAKVVIVVAGMEGALPSVVAGLVDAPVIGVPTSVGYGVAQGGMTALMGMLTSCAEGLTVVNIDNGFGAACAARAIIKRK